jgi:hypothetical protein
MKPCLFLLFPICIIITACSSPSHKTPHQKKVDPVALEILNISHKIKVKPLIFNIDSLFNRQEFKRSQYGSHSTVLSELPFLFEYDNNGFYMYFYFTKQRHLRHIKRKIISKKDFHLITAVKKPMNSNNRYLEVEETLVQLQSTINDPLLGAMNIVNQDTSSLNIRFGEPAYRFKGYHIYGNTQHILVVRHKKGIVQGFKYQYLKESITSTLDQNKCLLEDYIINFDTSY